MFSVPRVFLLPCSGTTFGCWAHTCSPRGSGVAQNVCVLLATSLLRISMTREGDASRSKRSIIMAVCRSTWAKPRGRVRREAGVAFEDALGWDNHAGLGEEAATRHRDMESIQGLRLL